MHFVFEWSGNNAFIGLFSPVNESVWEHMKLVFFPMLFYLIYASLFIRPKHPCINSSLIYGMLYGTFLIPVLFYTYTGMFGINNDVFNITIFFICVVTAFYVAYKQMLSRAACSDTVFLNTVLLLMAVTFFAFTIYPPGLPLFTSP